MQDLCPLCLQNDKKSKIKLLQINLEEAIWSCESEKCVWPFGYENLTYFSRKVGKTWSYHWDDYSLKNPIQHDMTLLKEIPVLVNANHNLKDLIDTKDIIIKSDEPPDCSLEIKQENSTDFAESSSDTQADIPEEKCIHEGQNSTVCKNISDVETKELSFETTNDNKESICLVEDNRIPIKEENETKPSIDSFKNLPEEIGTTKGFPQITSIEKTNIDISNYLTDGQVPAYSNCDKKTKPFASNPKNQNLQTKPVMYITVSTSSNTSSNVAKKPIIKVPKNINPPRPQSKQINQSQPSPVQLSHKAPTTSTVKGGSLKALKAEILQSRLLQPIKKLSSGKGYEKFSFSVIKKQMEKKEQTATKNTSITSKNLEATGTTIGRGNMPSEQINEAKVSGIKQDPLSSDATQTNTNASSNVTSHEQTEAGLGSVLLDTGISIKTEEINDVVIKSEFPSTEGITLSETNNCNGHQFNTTLDNTSASIDIVIDDLLNVDHSISENISDDWISSLLI